MKFLSKIIIGIGLSIGSLLPLQNKEDSTQNGIVVCTIERLQEMEGKNWRDAKLKKSLGPDLNKEVTNRLNEQRIYRSKPDSIMKKVNEGSKEAITQAFFTESYVGYSAVPEVYYLYRTNKEFKSSINDHLLSDVNFLNKADFYIHNIFGRNEKSSSMKEYITEDLYFNTEKYKYNQDITALAVRAFVKNMGNLYSQFHTRLKKKANGELEFDQNSPRAKSNEEVLNLTFLENESLEMVLNVLSPGLTLKEFKNFSNELKLVFYYTFFSMARMETGLKEIPRNVFGSQDYNPTHDNSLNPAEEFLQALNHMINTHQSFLENEDSKILLQYLKSKEMSDDFFFMLLVLNFSGYNSGPAYININEILTLAILIEQLKESGYDLPKITLTEIAIFTIMSHNKMYNEKMKNQPQKLVKMLIQLDPSVKSFYLEKFYNVSCNHRTLLNGDKKGDIVLNYVLALAVIPDIYGGLVSYLSDENKSQNEYFNYFMTESFKNEKTQLSKKPKLKRTETRKQKAPLPLRAHHSYLKKSTTMRSKMDRPKTVPRR